jgi:hypothetical protein
VRRSLPCSANAGSAETTLFALLTVKTDEGCAQAIIDVGKHPTLTAAFCGAALSPLKQLPLEGKLRPVAGFSQAG